MIDFEEFIVENVLELPKKTHNLENNKDISDHIPTETETDTARRIQKTEEAQESLINQIQSSDFTKPFIPEKPKGTSTRTQFLLPTIFEHKVPSSPKSEELSDRGLASTFAHQGTLSLYIIVV